MGKKDAKVAPAGKVTPKTDDAKKAAPEKPKKAAPEKPKKAAAEKPKRAAPEKPKKAAPEKSDKVPAKSAHGKAAELGETVESLDQMRSMWIQSSHILDSSAAVKNQNKLVGKSEYNFSIRNTDKTGRALGVAKNVQLSIKLPKAAKLQDAYFYLEAMSQHDSPKSMNCKLDHGDEHNNPKVNCLIPQVKDLVDVNVRADYDGDQADLQKLASDDVEATLHEGHEVLSTSKITALKRAPLMKQMPHQ